MTDTSLARKLLLKPRQRVAVLNAPSGYFARLGALPEGLEVAESLSREFDVVHLFCQNSSQFEGLVSKAKSAMKPGGILWVYYPKQSARLATDLNRDILRNLGATKGLTGVSLVSIDETWSAMPV